MSRTGYRYSPWVALAALALHFAACTPAEASTPVDAGYRIFSFPSGLGGNDAPTGEKPESKLWWNDGYWWAVMWESGNSAYHIYRLDLPSQDWIDTGTAVDDRSDTKCDALWDGNKLYVASHVFNKDGSSASSGNRGELFRYSYNSSTDSYSLDSGFPLEINQAESETLVIVKDTTGTLWATWVEDSEVMLNHTRNGDDTDWDTPFALPAVDASSLSSDDISSLVAFDGRIGAMWSNQDEKKMYFAVHVDGDPELTWNTVIAFGLSADDHISLKSIHSDPAGRVFAVVKTSISSPVIVLVVCEDTPNRCTNVNDWDFYTVYSNGSNSPTRPILLVDTENRELYVFTRNRDGTDDAIYYKQTSMDSISFSSGIGTAFIESSANNDINNPTSTKQNLNSATGLAVLASDDADNFYFHNHLALNSSSSEPVIISFVPTSGASGTEVTLSGLNFNGSFETTFGGATASFIIDSDTQIRATVPGGALTGPISVENNDGTGVTQTDFIVGATPIIASFAPEFGGYTTEVTLTGQEFTGATDVAFNGTAATFVVDSDTQIRADVPVGATAGPISVTNALGTDFSATDFVVTGVQLVATLQETENGNSSSSSSVSTSADLTAADDHLYVASIATKPSTAVTSVTGLGLTWTAAAVQCSGRNQTRVEIWTAQGQPGANGPVTATLTGPPSNAVITVTRYSGVDATSPIGATGSLNSNGPGGACSGGTDSSSYSFTIDTVGSGSLVHGAAAMRNRQHTPGSAYTEIDQLIGGSGGGAASVATQSTMASVPATVTVDGSFNGSTDWAAAALEVLSDGSVTCAENADCADGVYCNGDEFCDVGNVCASGPPPACDDGVACTDDICSPGTDACQSTPNDLACDNGLFCDGSETCDAVSGCLAAVFSCDDLVACTVDDCDEVGDVCTHTPDDVVCGDSDLCTTDVCDVVAGCSNPPLECDDADLCTTDSCAPATGCANDPISCDDTDLCTTDSCAPATGCANDPISCDDTDLCTTDSCAPATGCANDPISCDDTNLCTTDSCAPATGCANDPISCDDTDLCTTDSCAPATGCANDPISCDDTDLCTTDSCAPATGCANDPISCDDTDLCTTDSCAPATGCTNDPVDCDDTDLCTTDSCDPGTGACDNDPISCDDTDLCTTDSCAPATGCTNDPISCDDTDLCTTDSCAPATGCANDPISCDDTDACTIDSCDAAAGCVHIDTCAPAEIVLEQTATGGSASSATVATDTAFAAADGLYLAAVSSKPNRTVVSVTGLGVTWSRVREQCAGRNQTGIDVWMADSQPVAAGDVTATLSSAPSNAVIAVAWYTGVDPDGPIGAIESANTNGIGGACSGGSDQSSYAFPLTTTHDGATAFAAAAMRNRTHEPGTGYTENAEVSTGSGGGVASVALSDLPIDPAATISVDGTFSSDVDWAAVGIEIIPGSAAPACASNGDCNDGDFCNGQETCNGAACVAGVAPCPGQLCRESDDTCVDCLSAGDCDDGLFCSGAETCDAGGGCVAGGDPCAGQLCRESDDTCVDCLGAGDCDDGLFCSGVEDCQPNGTCSGGGDPCPGEICVESTSSCVGCTNNGDCDDLAFCNGMEQCSGGTCAPGSSPCPGQECRELDQSCVDCLDDGDCDDADVCNGMETCDVDGSCANGTPPNCDDSDLCTTDSCDPIIGCANTPLDCDDADACTSDGCAAGSCTYAPVDCDDSNPCTIDTCDVAAGCEYEDTCGPNEVLLEEIATGGSAASTTVTTDTALAAPADAFYLAAVTFKQNVAVQSVTGLGVTWSRVLAQCGGRSQTGVEVWMTDGPPTASTSVSATLAATPYNATIAVARYSGADPIAPIGSVASANTNGAGGGCSGGSDGPSYSFPLAATDTGAAAYVAASMRNRTHEPGTGYTEHAEVSAGSGGAVASVAVSDDLVDAPGTMPVDGTFSSDVDWAVIAVEVVP